MYRHLYLGLSLIAGCAMTMGADDFYRQFPALTKTRYLTGAEALASVNTQECVLLSTQRTYAAPMGLTTSGDIKNGADGVDAIVGADGGNAYRIAGYSWVPVELGTQLNVVFDTFLCKPLDNPSTPQDSPSTSATT